MKPRLLLIRGMMNDARVWAPVLAQLGDAAEPVVAEHGDAQTIAEMADAAWARVAGMAPAQPLVIAGFSMGGYVALAMLGAPRRPVAALALLSTSARPESPEGAALREKTIAAIDRDFAKVVDGVLAFGTHARFRGDAAALAAARQMMLDTGADAAARHNRAVMQRMDARELARSLRLPVLVMTGDDDRITPPPLADELAALIPGARRVAVAECGHLLPLEQPARVADALRALIAGAAGAAGAASATAPSPTHTTAR